MQYIPLILVLLATLITILISLFKDFEIILSLKNLSIVIILFYIIGNIVKKVLVRIIDMNKDGENNVEEDDTPEDGRADDQIITSDKSGDDFEE